MVGTWLAVSLGTMGGLVTFAPKDRSFTIDLSEEWEVIFADSGNLALPRGTTIPAGSFWSNRYDLTNSLEVRAGAKLEVEMVGLRYDEHSKSNHSIFITSLPHSPENKKAFDQIHEALTSLSPTRARRHLLGGRQATYYPMPGELGYPQIYVLTAKSRGRYYFITTAFPAHSRADYREDADRILSSLKFPSEKTNAQSMGPD